jgi:alpha-glucosidase (family GH31 glycosyl hydrolase)
VKAGFILLLGSSVESTHEKQSIAHVRVYPGADGDFTFYSDDGETYEYEAGDFQTTHLHWDDAAKKAGTDRGESME